MLNSVRADQMEPGFGKFGVVQKLEGAQELLIATMVRAQLPGLLAKLDAGAGVTDTDYAALCTPVCTGDVLAKFGTLLAKLDADAGVTDANFVVLLTATALTLGTQFNALLVKLDADAGVTDTDHGAKFAETAFPTCIDSLPPAF